MAHQSEEAVAIMEEFFPEENTTPESKNATEKKETAKQVRLRLDFNPDGPGVVRARLRSGSGKNRNKSNGGIYVPLGRIEDVYGDPYYSEWHSRCEQYASKTGYKLVKSGSGIRPNDSTANHGMDQPAEIRRESVLEDNHSQ